jgi:cytochrome c oxidase subunit 4
MSSAVGHHHIVPFKTYLNILIALVILTVLTVTAAHIEMEHTWHILIAILIATIKASLVAAYFMHLKYDDKMYRVILVAAVFFVIVMFTFCITDIMSRPIVTP